MLAQICAAIAEVLLRFAYDAYKQHQDNENRRKAEAYGKALDAIAESKRIAGDYKPVDPFIVRSGKIREQISSLGGTGVGKSGSGGSNGTDGE